MNMDSELHTCIKVASGLSGQCCGSMHRGHRALAADEDTFSATVACHFRLNAAGRVWP